MKNLLSSITIAAAVSLLASQPLFARDGQTGAILPSGNAIQTPASGPEDAEVQMGIAASCSPVEFYLVPAGYQTRSVLIHGNKVFATDNHFLGTISTTADELARHCGEAAPLKLSGDLTVRAIKHDATFGCSSSLSGFDWIKKAGCASISSWSKLVIYNKFSEEIFLTTESGE